MQLLLSMLLSLLPLLKDNLVIKVSKQMARYKWKVKSVLPLPMTLKAHFLKACTENNVLVCPISTCSE